MRRADAVCADNRRPAGVTNAFQVCEYSIEPTVSNRARNLLAKDALRASLFDEPKKLWPEVARVCVPFAFAGRRVGLTWAGAGPDFAVGRPACECEGEVPPSDPGEEMGTAKPGKLGSSDFLDASFIDDPLRNFSGGSEVPKPLRGVYVELVVVVHFGL